MAPGHTHHGGEVREREGGSFVSGGEMGRRGVRDSERRVGRRAKAPASRLRFVGSSRHVSRPRRQPRGTRTSRGSRCGAGDAANSDVLLSYWTNAVGPTSWVTGATGRRPRYEQFASPPISAT
ncbi:hypothetical protein BHE74_00043348 [Ensete ventricosum]|nr:hypothetical protein GW17_00035380 [Ensete ventricosum]RWW50387.1 hypothetical protein BHE74_00043348 [Ensete ventricosum]